MSLRPGSGAAAVFRWGMFPLVALSAVLALALLNRGDAWTVAGISGSGILRIDDRAVDPEDLAALHRALRGAHHIETDDSIRVVLQLGHRVFLEIDAATRVTCPNSPGRFVDTDLNISLAAGAVRIVTGADFSGRLHVWTPEARAEVSSATLCMERGASGSRVSVYEGHVDIGSGTREGSTNIRAGEGAFVPVSGPEVRSETLTPEERARLGALRGRAFRQP